MTYEEQRLWGAAFFVLFVLLTVGFASLAASWQWWRDRQRHKRDFAVLKSREEYVGRKYR